MSVTRDKAYMLNITEAQEETCMVSLCILFLRVSSSDVGATIVLVVQ